VARVLSSAWAHWKRRMERLQDAARPDLAISAAQ
jgi:hypothetical protein